MMNKQILATAPLLTIAGLAGTTAPQPAQAIQVVENSLKKEIKVVEPFTKSSGSDFASILIAFGVILAIGSTVSAVWKAFDIGKSSSKHVKTEQQKAEEPSETITPETIIANNTTSGVKQITPKVLLEQAYTFFQQGDAQRALAEFNNAIRIHPHNAYLYTERANFRRRNLGDRVGALEDYTQAITLHPDNALFYLWRSQLYHEIGDKFKAMSDYNTAVRLAPEGTMYHFFQNNFTSGRR